jgi:hypothetical protein
MLTDFVTPSRCIVARHEYTARAQSSGVPLIQSQYRAPQFYAVEARFPEPQIRLGDLNMT